MILLCRSQSAKSSRAPSTAPGRRRPAHRRYGSGCQRHHGPRAVQRLVRLQDDVHGRRLRRLGPDSGRRGVQRRLLVPGRPLDLGARRNDRGLPGPGPPAPKIPGGAFLTELTGTSCIASGYYETGTESSPTGDGPVAEEWNGKTWKAILYGPVNSDLGADVSWFWNGTSWK